MHLFSPTFLLYLHGLLLALVALGSADSDVDFMSVRAKFLKDYSGKGGEPGKKYFSKCWRLSWCFLLSSWIRIYFSFFGIALTHY
jgi:hypothetical protein